MKNANVPALRTDDLDLAEAIAAWRDLPAVDRDEVLLNPLGSTSEARHAMRELLRLAGR